MLNYFLSHFFLNQIYEYPHLGRDPFVLVVDELLLLSSVQQRYPESKIGAIHLIRLNKRWQ